MEGNSREWLVAAAAAAALVRCCFHCFPERFSLNYVVLLGCCFHYVPERFRNGSELLLNY